MDNLTTKELKDKIDSLLDMQTSMLAEIQALRKQMTDVHKLYFNVPVKIKKDKADFKAMIRAQLYAPKKIKSKK